VRRWDLATRLDRDLDVWRSSETTAASGSRIADRGSRIAVPFIKSKSCFHTTNWCSNAEKRLRVVVNLIEMSNSESSGVK